jgi:hypothetical protein
MAATTGHSINTEPYGENTEIYSSLNRLKYEKLTDGRRTPSDGNTSHDPLGQVS